MKNKLTFEESKRLFDLGYNPPKQRSAWRKPLFGDGEWKFCRPKDLMCELSESIPGFYCSDVLQLLAKKAVDFRSHVPGYNGSYVHITERGDRQWEVVFRNFSACRINLIDAAFSLIMQMEAAQND